MYTLLLSGSRGILIRESCSFEGNSAV